MIDLAPEHLKTVQRILAEIVPDCEVRAFGSRATWTATEHSDLDLAIISPEPLAWVRRSRLSEAFEESDLPIRVDVVDWKSLSDGFRQSIDGDCEVLQERSVFGNWRDTVLGDVVDINPKRALKRGDESPFVAMADVQEHRRQLPKISTREFKGSGSRFRNGDTLLARITPCLENGKTAWVSGLVDDEIGHGSTEFIVLSAIDGLTDPLFVYYLARHPSFREFAIGQMTGTSGRQRVPVAAVESYRLSLPPLHEQRRIAHILGTLDDKIELNRRMSQTLEAMAQALFKSWFVDFDPVRAKAEGRPTNLPPDLDALFPNSFQDSELGEIPEGWEVRSLDEIATFTNGLALQRFPPTGEGWLPVIKIAEMRKGYTDRTAKASPDIDPKYIIEDGDLLFSWSGSLELTLWSHGRGALNQHLFKVTSDVFPLWFYWGWLRQHLDDFRRIAAGKATTMGHIQRHHLTEANVLVPSREALGGANDSLDALSRQQVGYAAQSRTLEAHRDMLMRNLIAGGH